MHICFAVLKGSGWNRSRCFFAAHWRGTPNECVCRTDTEMCFHKPLKLQISNILFLDSCPEYHFYGFRSSVRITWDNSRPTLNWSVVRNLFSKSLTYHVGFEMMLSSSAPVQNEILKFECSFHIFSLCFLTYWGIPAAFCMNFNKPVSQNTAGIQRNTFVHLLVHMSKCVSIAAFIQLHLYSAALFCINNTNKEWGALLFCPEDESMSE